MEDQPIAFITEDQIKDANARFDREHPDFIAPMRSAWNVDFLIRRGYLTDRNIEHYEKEGFYAPEFKAARKVLADKKAKRRLKREGNFSLVDGRMIYRPN